MRRRDGSPLWIDDAQQPAVVLRRADLGTKSGLGHYDEAWLQTLLHSHPEIFPIEQIEPGFGELIPLCCELPLLFGGGRSGALDNLLTTRDGGLVLVEAKLWRNPEARRSAVAQAMEYAAAVFRMSYSELESAVSKARHAGKMPAASLFEIIAGNSEDVDETEFIDAVSRNLERGRAIIAVLGDGIREDIIPLANLLQSHAGHRFTFALVELAIYETPATGVRLVVPSVLAQTMLIERGVVRIEGDGQVGLRVIVEPASLPSDPSPGRRISIGEDEFFELLGQRDPGLPGVLKAFLAKAEGVGVYAERQGGLNLKHPSPMGHPFNMGTISKGGFVDTAPSTWWGRRPWGQTYNETLAKRIGGLVTPSKNGEESALRTAAGKTPQLSDLLPQHEQAWLDAMEQYIRESQSAINTDMKAPEAS
jgi:hypothetical protein